LKDYRYLKNLLSVSDQDLEIFKNQHSLQSDADAVLFVLKKISHYRVKKDYNNKEGGS
jgi:hypothetical protein